VFHALLFDFDFDFGFFIWLGPRPPLLAIFYELLFGFVRAVVCP
jgi:hypothetical protein